MRPRTNDNDGAELSELSYWDFPDTTHVLVGDRMKCVPVASDDNMGILIKEHNKMVRIVKSLTNDVKVINRDWL